MIKIEIPSRSYVWVMMLFFKTLSRNPRRLVCHERRYIKAGLIFLMFIRPSHLFLSCSEEHPHSTEYFIFLCVLWFGLSFASSSLFQLELCQNSSSPRHSHDLENLASSGAYTKYISLFSCRLRTLKDIVMSCTLYASPCNSPRVGP